MIFCFIETFSFCIFCLQTLLYKKKVSFSLHMLQLPRCRLVALWFGCWFIDRHPNHRVNYFLPTNILLILKAIDWPKNRAVSISSYQRGRFDVLVIVLLNLPDLKDTKSISQFLIIPDSETEILLSKPNELRLNNGRTIQEKKIKRNFQNSLEVSFYNGLNLDY